MTRIRYFVLRHRFKKLPLRLGQLRGDLRRLNIQAASARQARTAHVEEEVRHA